MKLRSHIFTSLTVLMFVLLSSCGGDDQSPGVEYMPDMYRSPALEAYVDYGQDPYYVDEDKVLGQRNTMSVRKPVKGTIMFSMDTSKAYFNFPYPYENTTEGYELAGQELKSPITMTEETVAEGKVLYEKFCDHCHGKTGLGDGAVVSVGGHPPPNAYNNQLKDLPEGKMFHSVTYGKGVMGSHASQLNKEERWKVIHYVQTLQKEGNEDSSNAEESANDTTAQAIVTE